MEDADEAGAETTGRRLKLTGLIDDYDIDGIGAELEQRRTADVENRSSLRDLADYFNRQLLATKIDEMDIRPLDGEIKNIYRLLADTDVSEANRNQIRRRLEREGVDVDQIRSDFVTSQAIRTYLKTFRNAEYDRSDRDRIESDADNFQQLRNWISVVTESKFEHLHNTDEITLPEFRTLVDITVICEGCCERYQVTDLLERKCCTCSEHR